MKRPLIPLSLVLVVVWLGSGVGLAAPPLAAEPGQVPVAPKPSEWQGTQVQVAKLIASDGTANDLFGCSVSVHGETTVIGARNAEVGGISGEGAVYVFYRNQGGPGAWGQIAKLTAADATSFGTAVSISGDTAVVGASGTDVGGNVAQGAAYIYYRDHDGPDAWGQVARLIATDGGDWDAFGVSVSVSGDTALAGAIRADVGDSVEQGAAYIFYRDQGGADSWGQVAKLVAADGTGGDWFGYRVSISGDTAVVVTGQGAAYIFYRDQGAPDNWGQVVKLTAADALGPVSASGNTVIVGATGADVGGNVDQGAAYVFYRDQGGTDLWGQVAKVAAAEGVQYDYFGGSVSISGDTAVVGATGDWVMGDARGAAYVFNRNLGGADAWGEAAALIAADGAARDRFGCSVAVSDGVVVVGADQADVGSNYDQGAAYVFWLPQHSVYLPLVNRNYAP